MVAALLFQRLCCQETARLSYLLLSSESLHLDVAFILFLFFSDSNLFGLSCCLYNLRFANIASRRAALCCAKIGNAERCPSGLMGKPGVFRGF